ncbi:MAG: GGDEF domain-containing protein [Syntrophobacteraceae bacterium]
MGQNASRTFSCPEGRDQCPFIEEVEHLRKEHARLLELSITDPLTGFYNYRHFIQSLETELERTRRSGLPTALIMIDLDRFKKINDTYGHSAGDHALKWACRIWRENIRRIDIPCRYGGEEFAIILPGTNLSRAAILAERLRKTLAASPVQFDTHTIPLTASFGVSANVGNQPALAQELIDSADQLLLRAKTQGRNRVCTDFVEEDKARLGVTSEEREALFGSGWDVANDSPSLEDVEKDGAAK